MKRPASSLPALAVLAVGALLGTGIAPASAGGWHHPPHSPRPVPSAGEITTLVDGLTQPLGFAVGRRGSTFDVAQSSAGILTRHTPDGATQVLDAGTEGFSTGSVSRAGGRTFYTVSAGAGPENPAPNITQLKSVDRNGTVRTLADISAHENAQNPDAGNSYGFENLDPACAASIPAGIPVSYPGIVDSNPYATLPVRGGIIVADAGMNALVRVDRRGTVSTVAVLPPIPVEITAEVAQANGLPECTVGLTYRVEPVPTDLARGPHGELYVASLPGGPGGPYGSVFRVDPSSGATELVATGLTSATGLAVNRRGDIFVAELFANRISVIPAGSDTPQLFAEVPEPGGVELRGSTLYASANVLTPGADGSPQGRIIGIEVDGGRGGHHGGSYSLEEDDALEDAPLSD